ncbi:MAG: stage III sporulation protein AB [Oscillospiraceae bacterium]|jgi:stage III sporulation protein AB|nr:stage III sporulation protein AB [Oscillospiraceae bacterium]
MMILRFSGAAAVALCGFLAGKLFADRLKARRDELESLCHMAVYISTQIRYACRPLDELFEEMRRESGFWKLPFVAGCSLFMAGGKAFPEAFRKSLEQSKSRMNLWEEDFAVLESLGRELGASDTEGQLKTLALFQEKIARRRDEAIEEYKKNGAIYQKLGFLAGLGLAVLIL